MAITKKSYAVTTTDESTFKLYKERYLVAAVVIFLQIVNGLMRIAFSMVPNMAASYFQTTYSNIDWMMTTGFVTDVVLSFPAMWFYDQFGLKYTIYVSGVTTSVGSVIRLFGTCYFVPVEYKFAVTLIGQTIIAFATPFLMSLPAAVSQLWFPDHQRIFCTTLCLISPFVGADFARLITPLATTSPSTVYLSNNYICPVAIVGGLCCFAVTKSKPPTPPSASSSIKKVTNFKTFIKDLRIILTNKTILFYIIAGGCTLVAVPGTFHTMAHQFLCPYGYSNIFNGSIQCVIAIVGIFSSILLGIIAEKTTFYQDILNTTIAFGNTFLVAFCLCSRLLNHEILVGAMFVLHGATAIASWSIITELTVETAYPINEGIVTNFFSLLSNIWCTILVPLSMKFARPLNAIQSRVQICTVSDFIQAYDMTNAEIFLMALNTLACIVLILFCRPKWNRRNLKLAIKTTTSDNLESVNTTFQQL